MKEVSYHGSLWSKAAALFTFALAGAAFRTVELDTFSSYYTTIVGTSLLAFYCIHELLRQSRPSVVISTDILRWQPAALWSPEESILWKEILRIESKYFRILTLTTRAGTSHTIPLLGISSSERKAIFNTISERIAE